MTASPVVEWRAVASPNGVISAQAMVGSGFGGSIPVGSASNVVTLRLYNNFAGNANIADALNCVLASYDDTLHQGQATTQAVIGLFCQVQVLDYNGSTSNGDLVTYAIGGQTKHPILVNTGTISGAIGGGTGNYATISVQVVIPPGATQGSITQGLWVEYSATS